MRINYFILFFFLTASSLLAQDSLRQPSWAIYANLSARSVLQAHVGFEKFFNTKQSISFDADWHYRSPDYPCYPLSFVRRNGGSLTTTFHFHNTKPKGVRFSSGVGLLLGYFYINDLRYTWCQSARYIINEKVPAAGLLYVGRGVYKKIPYLEMFIKIGARYSNAHIYREHMNPSISVQYELWHQLSPIADIGFRLQFMKLKQLK